MSTQPELTPELVQRVARLAGLELSPERAAELALGLEPILKGDAGIVALDLGPLSAVGPCWLGASDD